nr:uncharacterized protein LOC129450786 isoform X1 [Misgurnus anguillicaudatus]
MWLLLGFCLTSSLIHSVQMLQCWSGLNYQNASLADCPANYYCAVVFQSYLGNSSTLQTCLSNETTCNITTPTSVNFGFFDVTLSCCDTDGCNNVSLPEKNNVPNGLKCDSCNSMEDKECKTPLSCVGDQECCFNMTDFEVLGNYTLKGCASKNFRGISSNSTVSLSCYNKGNLNPTPKPTTNTTTYTNFTSSNAVQMLQCWIGLNYQNASLKACPANYYCAVIQSGNSSTVQTCLSNEKTCNFTTPTIVNLGFYDVILSCCNTDGCNNVSLPEKNNVPNGLKCDSCNSTEDRECKTPLSCVGDQECCFNMTDFVLLGNYTLKGCASKNFRGISSNSTVSLSCYNKGNLNPTPKPTTNTKSTYTNFTSSNAVQMLQCWSGLNYQNASLKACPANYYCAVLQSGNSSTVQTCLSNEKTCNFTTPTIVNLGFYDVILSCCNTDGCNNVSLPEKNNVLNGLKCDSCNSAEDKECKTPLSCVGAQECCFTMTDFEVLGNYTWKGCTSKKFRGITSNSTVSLSCYNKGNLNPTPKPTTSTNTKSTTYTKFTSKYTPGNKSASWLRVHTCSLLLMSLSAIFLKEVN